VSEPFRKTGTSGRTSTPPATPRSTAQPEGDRPTVSPPFDVAAFARAATATTSEGSEASDASTRPPPPDFEDGELGLERDTLTDGVELEIARARSADTGDLGPRPSSGPLAIANQLAPSVPPEPTGYTPPPGTESRWSKASATSDPGQHGAGAPEITERTIDDPVAEMRERCSLGDYSGALEMADLILTADPGNLEAAECGEMCRTVLEGMYAARLGSGDRVPIVIVPRAQLQWLSIDHRAGFILSLIDGSSTLEMVVDVSGMQRLDALRILQELVQQRIVAFRR
jgi:hypothetical protein